MSPDPCILVVDVETTGLRANHCITQIGAYAIHLPTRQFVSYGEMSVRLSSEQLPLMTKEAADVQGWTPEKNEQALPFDEASQQFSQWISGFPARMGYVAHNADFDRYHLTRQSFIKDDLPWYCTRKGLSLYAQRYKPPIQNHKLASLAQVCGFQNPNPHSGGADALTAAHGYLWLTSQGIHPSEMQA